MAQPTSSLQAAREEAIDTLCRSFAEDELSMAELDRRLARAREARTRDELRDLLSDLRAASAPPVRTGAGAGAGAGKASPAERGGGDVARPDRADIRPSSHLALAVMGGTRRAGKWAPPANMLAIAIMGGIELDFRDAVLAEGVTDINVFAFWGGVEIIVPPDVHVDSHGFALMAGFEQTAEHESRPPPGAPTIRVNGAAIMAGVEIKVKPRTPEGTALPGPEQEW